MRDLVLNRRLGQYLTVTTFLLHRIRPSAWPLQEGEGEGEIALGPICLAFAVQQAQPLLRRPLERTSVVNGNILNSKGVHVGVVVGDEVFGLKGQKLYDLKGSNIYKLNGDLVGHLSDARGAEKRLDKATDKLFPST